MPTEAQREVPSTQLAADRVAADEGAVVVAHAAQHPAHAELLGRDPVVVGEREPAVVPLDVDQRQAGLDAQHHQRLLAERPEAVAASGLEHRVEDVERVLGLDVISKPRSPV